MGEWAVGSVACTEKAVACRELVGAACGVLCGVCDEGCASPASVPASCERACFGVAKFVTV